MSSTEDKSRTHAAWERWAPLVVVCVVVLAYANGFGGEFVFDDEYAILHNQSIRRMSPLYTARPVVNLTFGLNYLFGRYAYADYLAGNLLIHVLAGLTLFGVVRRTLRLPALRERYGAESTWLALACSLLWAAHPLLTQSVTYIVQRAESLTGLFYLLTLYAAIRGHESRVPHRWYTAAVVACALGGGTKPVIATAPAVVFFYDLIFLSRSLRATLRERWGLYAGLAATWLPIAVLRLAGLANGKPPSMGFGYKGVTPLAYLGTQFGVITHYLRLAVWPDVLCFDYMWPVARTAGAIVPPALFICSLGLLTLWALWRHPRWGFLGAWFFAILAPSSSFMPIADRAVEHRMYLSLAAVVALTVFGAHELLVRRLRSHWRGALEVALMCAVAAVLANLTLRRNEDYRTGETVWRDVQTKRPTNPRACMNLGALLANRGQCAEAVPHFRNAIRLRPDYAAAHRNLGVALIGLKRYDEGIDACRLALKHAQKDSVVARAHFTIGYAMSAQSRWEEAVAAYSEAVREQPSYAEGHYNLACALDELGRADEAVFHYSRTIRIQPEYAGAHNGLAVIMLRSKRYEAGIRHLVQAIKISPAYPEARYNLGNAMLELGRADEAIQCLSEAIMLRPRFADAQNTMGVALLRKNRVEEALRSFSRALAVNPDHARARRNLDRALRKEGREGTMAPPQTETPSARVESSG